MIDVESDDLRPVNQVVEARLGKRISPATIWRWHTHGVAGGIKLECVRVAGVLCTTNEAFADFIRRQNPAHDEPAPAERSKSTEQRLQASGLI